MHRGAAAWQYYRSVQPGEAVTNRSVPQMSSFVFINHGQFPFSSLNLMKVESVSLLGVSPKEDIVVRLEELNEMPTIQWPQRGHSEHVVARDWIC